MIIRIYIFSALALTGLVHGAGAEVWTSGQLEVKRFMQKMYSYDPGSFEAGDFDSKLQPFLMNRITSNGGKYSPTKKCELLREFFEESLIIKRQVAREKTECAPGQTGPNGSVSTSPFVRYPTLDSENHSPETRYIDIPEPKVDVPVLNGNQAKVAVFTGNGKEFPIGRSLYFLTKTENGWRISNFMLHWKWPDVDDGVNNCYFAFAREPSAEEAKEIPHHCRR